MKQRGGPGAAWGVGAGGKWADGWVVQPAGQHRPSTMVWSRGEASAQPGPALSPGSHHWDRISRVGSVQLNPRLCACVGGPHFQVNCISPQGGLACERPLPQSSCFQAWHDTSLQLGYKINPRENPSKNLLDLMHPHEPYHSKFPLGRWENLPSSNDLDLRNCQQSPDPSL